MSGLRSWLEAEIGAGRELPTQKEIAKRFGVSQPTVAEVIKRIRRGDLSESQIYAFSQLHKAKRAVEEEEWDLVQVYLNRVLDRIGGQR